MKRHLLPLTGLLLLASLYIFNGCTKSIKGSGDSGKTGGTTTDTVTVSNCDSTGKHINDSLWAFYPFAGNLVDSSGHNHTLTLVSGVSLGYDMWGNANNALDFSGAPGAYAEIADGTSFSPAAFSVSLFIHYRVVGGFGFTKTNFSDATGTSFSIGMDPRNYIDTLRYAIGTTPNNCSTPNSSGVSIKNNDSAHLYAWYHVVATFSNGVGKFYVNGELKNSATMTFNTIPWCSNAPFILGNWWSLDDVVPAFNGKMDEIRIYSREITATEVAYLYNHFTTK